MNVQLETIAAEILLHVLIHPQRMNVHAHLVILATVCQLQEVF